MVVCRMTYAATFSWLHRGFTVLPVGDNLFETLVLNLVEYNQQRWWHLSVRLPGLPHLAISSELGMWPLMGRFAVPDVSAQKSLGECS